MKYFGTDGIRGEVGSSLTYDMATRLGKSLYKLNCDTVVIGYDTRESKDMFAKSIIEGALISGLNVIDGGVVPTPALIYYSQEKQILGVMITASHNPYTDNGLKVLNKGVKLSLEEELLIEEEMDSNTTINKQGTVTKSDDVKNLYLGFLNNFKFTTKFKVAIDCANGACYETGPYIFNKLCKNLVVSADKPNGININNGVGSTHLSNIKEVVLKNNCDIGFSFDGDADRVLVVDSKGNTIDGDQIIFIIASYLKTNNKLNKDTIVLTKMSNLGILNRLKELNINISLTDVGDKYVVRELMANNFSIGGENSGHIIMPDTLPTGDGVLVAVTLLKIMEELNKTPNELLGGITMYADKMVNLKVKDKTIISTAVVVDKINEIQNILKDDGKVIVRASGTENLIRVSVMAKTIDLVDKYIKELVDMIGDK